MKNRILSLLLAICLIVLALPMSVAAAESFTYKVSATTTTPTIGNEFEVVISLTNYDSLNAEIRGLQIDITNIDTNVFEIVSHSSMISDASAASNKTSYSSSKNYIRLVYLQLAGSMDKSVTDVMKFRLKVKSDLTEYGSITLPITLKIGTMSENITLTDLLTINYTPMLDVIVNGVQNMQITPSDTNFFVTWDAYPDATKYTLYVKNEEGKTIITKVLAATATSAYLTWPKELEWDKNYLIGVRVRTTQWLDTVWKDAALAVGNRIVDVKTESAGRTIKVTWRAYEGATQYRAYVYKEDGTYVTNVVSTTNSASIINAIDPEVDYIVKVIATKGVTMKAADAMQIPARLNIFHPTSFWTRGVTPNKAAVSWDEVRGTYKYWAYLTPVDGGTTITRESKKAIATFSGLKPNTTYQVKMKLSIVDADGKTHYTEEAKVLGTFTTGSWEDVNFTAAGTDAGAELSWTAPTNANGYIIYRSTNGGKTYFKYKTITDGATTSLVDTTAKNGYRYGIVVKLKDDVVTTSSKMTKAESIVK